MVNNKFPSYVGAMRHGIIASLLSAVMLCGCSEEKPHAVIDDAFPFTRYQLIAVDGRPVVRGAGRSTIATVRPMAIIPPGVHSLTTKCTDGIGVPTATFTANMEAGKRYRIAATGASVVEMGDRH